MRRNFPADIENGSINPQLFEDQLIRKAFIKKVYFILSIQLLITLGFIATFVFVKELHECVVEHSYLVIIALVIVLITIIVLACCSDFRRKEPMNYICLGIFTIAESFLLGVIASFYDPMIVLTAVGITAAICFVLTIYAMQSKYDFTVMGGFLLVCLLVGLTLGILLIFFHDQTLKIVYSSVGVVLFSMFLIFDTQLMLGGQHRYAISPDEYVFGALNLYIDIIQIFMCILRLFGSNR